MPITIGAPVWASDNRQLGQVDALIVDEAGAAIRAVVVRRNGDLTRDVEVPIELLTPGDDGRLVWSGAHGEIDSLAGFAEANYVSPQTGSALPAGYSADGLLVPSSGYVPLPAQSTPTSQQAAPPRSGGQPPRG